MKSFNDIDSLIWTLEGRYIDNFNSKLDLALKYQDLVLALKEIKGYHKQYQKKRFAYDKAISNLIDELDEEEQITAEKITKRLDDILDENMEDSEWLEE